MRTSGIDPEHDFLDYLARRLGVEHGEARARLKTWLVHYEPESRPRQERSFSAFENDAAPSAGE